MNARDLHDSNDEVQNSAYLQLMRLLVIGNQDKTIPSEIKEKLAQIANEYNAVLKSEHELGRDVHKRLLSTLVEQLLVICNSKDLNRPEVKSLLSFMKDTLKFVKTVIDGKLKDQLNYRAELNKNVEKLNDIFRKSGSKNESRDEKAEKPVPTRNRKMSGN